MSETAATELSAEKKPARARGSIARNAFHLLLGQVGTTTLAVFLAAALGRNLGATDLGLYYVISAPATFALVLVEWGQTSYVIREVARHPQRSGILLGSALGLRAGGSVLVAFLTAVFMFLFYDRGTGAFTALFIATTLPFFLAQAYGMVFRGQEHMDLDATVSVVNKTLVLLVTLAAFKLKGGLLGALLAQGAAGLGALAAATFLFSRLNIDKLKASLSTAKELLIGGTPIVAMSLATTAQGAIETLMLSKLAPLEAVGWFGAARNIFGTLAAASFILGSASFPRLSRAAHDLPKFRQELEVGLRPLLGLAALVAVGSYLFGDFAVNLVFGRAKFAPAAVIIQASGPGQAFLFADVFFASAIIAVGRSTQLAVAKALSLLATVGLNFLLIPYFQSHYGNGGIGLVLASAGTEVLMFTAVAFILPRGTLAGAMLIDVGRALAASAGTLLVFMLLPHFSAWLGIPLCIVVFAGLATAVGLIRRAELEIVRGALRRSRGS